MMSYYEVSTTILSFFVLLVIWMKIRKNKSKKKPKLPPGPRRLPLIGSMHHLIGCIPHQKMRDLAKEHGPIMHLQLGELTNIIISSPEAAEQILKTHDLIFAQRPQMSGVKSVSYGYIDMTFCRYGEYWRQIRKLSTMELLTAKRVRDYRSIRVEETSKMIESISSNAYSGSAINFSRMIASLSYKIVSRIAIGKVWKAEDTFLECIEGVLNLLGNGISIADAYPSIKLLQRLSWTNYKIEQLIRKIDPVLQTIIEENRSAKNREGDKHLANVLLNLQQTGEFAFPITDDTIKALILDTFIAGVDTSSAASDWMMAELMKNPEVMKKAQEEIREKCKGKGKVEEEDLEDMKYLKMVIKETFRLHPGAPLLVPRECRESCVIDGYDFPENSKIFINTWAMGRDPKYWEDPESFKPERFDDNSISFAGNNYKYLPFGAGRRSCPGMLFGLASVELPMANLLFHFDWKIAGGVEPQQLDMSEEIGVVTKRKANLLIIPHLPTSN